MYNWKLIDQLLLTFKFCGRDIQGIYFSTFASCEPLIQVSFCSSVYGTQKSSSHKSHIGQKKCFTPKYREKCIYFVLTQNTLVNICHK